MKNRLLSLICLSLFMAYSLIAMGNSPNDGSFKTEFSSFSLLSPPGAGINYVSDGGCVPVTVQFASQLGGTGYYWDFGDGGNSTDCNPIHTYTVAGTYTVVHSSSAGIDSVVITVGDNPVVNFSGDSVACQFDSKYYTITSTIPPASYNWNAQGGTVTSSDSASATISWNSYGVNYIHYTITTADGCTKVFTYKIKVIPPPSVNLPCCDKRDNATGGGGNPNGHEGTPGGAEPCDICAGSYSCYQATIDPQFGIAAEYIWGWTVTNGTIVSLSPDSTKICVVWGSSGIGTITLVTEHKIYGCKTIRECEYSILPGITPSFVVSGTCVSQPVTFDATGTTPLSDVVSYFWEFGDGYTETTYLPSTSHQFTFTGTYTATLTIKTKENCIYKIKKSFTVISGTRPEIECPGTVCEGTRQCYSTTLIPGASYSWLVSGDVPLQQSISADGNEICVTWGPGPVGTLQVTVTGGGYTCTNTATAVVAIVGSTIPIDGPDFICTTTGFAQVSTTNYTGACYSWTINGVPQTATGNVLTFFPSSPPLDMATTLNIEVEVDFGLGCCKGKGQKAIKKLQQYTMLLNTSNSTVCIGSQHTYFLLFPSGIPVPPVSWSVEGGTIDTFTSSYVTVTWNTVGPGSITAGNNTPALYCNDGSNSTWNINVLDKASGDDISGPDMVCADGLTSYTFYHGWASPTGSVTVSVSPGGTTLSTGLYSSDIVFNTPGVYTVSVTYNHTSLFNCGTTKTFVVNAIDPAIPAFVIPAGNVCMGDIVTYTASIPDVSFYDWNVIGGTLLSENWAAGILTLQIQWNSTVTSGITVTNKACGTSATQDITVYGKPIAIITPSDVTCSTTGVTMDVAPIWAGYLWSDGSTGNSITVTSPGNYWVRVFNGFCYDYDSITIAVTNPMPPVLSSFTVTPPATDVCPKYNQICPNITPGTGSIVSYNWSFSGFTISSSSAVCPFAAVAANPGTGNWSLVITDSYGCTDSLSGSLSDTCTPDTSTVPPCSFIATFAISYAPCTGQFTSTGTNYSSVIWYFGDGTFGSGLNPIHVYSTPCAKTVSCYVEDINGCDSVFTFTIPVPYVISNPEINVTNAACVGAVSISADGLAECGTPTATYDWIITPLAGGPSYITTTSSNTLNVGTIGAIVNGDHNAQVTMIVGACSVTVSTTFNKGGLEAFFVSCGGCAGSPLTFTDLSTPYQAPIIQWQWTFSPGTYSSLLQNPTINFATPNTYTGTLVVTDNDLCVDSYNLTFTVLPTFAPGDILVNGTPTSSGSSFDICPGDMYTLAAPPGGISWIWSNGSTTSSIVVGQPGDYFVTVFDSNNCAAKVGPIKIRHKPGPEAIILTSGNCSPMLLRAFTGTGYTYEWKIGATVVSTQPLYYLATSSTITLTVTNVHLCSHSTTLPFTVFPSPNASISYAPTPFCPGTTVTLTAAVSSGTAPYTHLWNNGDSTTSFATSTPGLYSYIVTDANGCKGTSQYDLQPVLPSGMDQLPFGCYDVCGPVTFCDGTMPAGWTGEWFNGSTSYAFINTGDPTAVPLTSSGTYTLHYTPINPATHCPAVSKPLTITINTLPSFTITGSTELCKSPGQSTLLTVDPQDPMYIYTWFLNGVVVGTGYTYTATAPGTYVVEIMENACCVTRDSIIIEEVFCCFENPGVRFKQILSDTTVSSTEFWYDKYYIDATVTVIGKAILDLTNVDIAFGMNGRIVLEDSSFLRTNNSVLRPCDKDSIWPGITFKDWSEGWINTTTIKNAIVAVKIEGPYASARLTDNSFIKCQTSVWITKGRKQQSISGNTFEVDNTLLPYPASPTVYWGIRLDDAEMWGLISQNAFRHVHPAQGNNIYFGIYSRSSTYTASENEFNDMFRAIDVTGSWDVVALEKNEIKLNTLKEIYDSYQIRVTDCETPVLIYENTMDNGLGDQSLAGAIYCENTYRTHIKDNKLNGFFHGIRSVGTMAIHITSNEITSSSSVGISLDESRDAIVSCNTIKAMVTNGSLFGGNPLLGIEDYEGRDNFEYANCIFNMHTSIYLFSSSGSNLPTLVNNYLYNYTANGVYNDGYNGSIGNPGGATAAGRNTFMSNNGATGTTIDINSISTFINEGGNFGLLLTNNVGSTTPGNMFYSTSDCGHQIQPTYPKNQLDRYNICDVYYLEQWIDKNANGKYILLPMPNEISSAYINEQLAAGKSEVLGQIAAQMLLGSEQAKRAVDAVLASTLDKNTAARLIISNCIAIGDLQLASGSLISAQLRGIDPDLRKILEIAIEVVDKNELSESHRSILKAIDDRNTPFSPLARDIIQSRNGEHDYKFYVRPEPVFGEADNLLPRDKNTLSVYPVPASDEIHVKHHIQDANVEGIRILSVTGAEVEDFSYTIQSGVVRIDISSLAPGFYSVLLITDGTETKGLSGKFIKR